MPMVHKFKLTIGIFLLICTCLPLGSCEKKHTGFVNENLSASRQTATDYLIPVLQVDINEPEDSLLFISMIWPLPFLIITRKRVKSSVKKRISTLFELFFSLFSAFVIYSFVFDLFYEPMIWGYFAFSLICLYVLITLYEIIKSFAAVNKSTKEKPSP